MTTTWAIDTETHAIAPRSSIVTRGGAEVHTSPHCTPRLVVGAICSSDQHVLLGREDFLDALYCHLSKGGVVVGHNVLFDLDVCVAAAPHTGGFLVAVEVALVEGRIHDTMFLDQLLGLARGRYDLPVFDFQSRTWSTPDLKNRSLADLAQYYLGKTLAKDESLRLTWAQFEGLRVSQIPAGHRNYALQDARVTWDLYQHFRHLIPEEHRLSEPLQLRAAWVLYQMDKRGVAINQDEAARLHSQFSTLLRPIDARLVDLGLGWWVPERGSIAKEKHTGEQPSAVAALAHADPYLWKEWRLDPFSGCIVRYRAYKHHGYADSTDRFAFALNTKAVERALGCLPVPILAAAPRTPLTKRLALDYDFWSQHIPADNEALGLWLEHEKIQKVLGTYLDLYRRTPAVFPRWHVLGARSGRMSASRPSVQNVPKRRYGIRSLFVPRPGHVFVRADYSAQEMYTLCEAMLHLGLPRGPLYDTLASGQDIHRFAAAFTLRKPAEAVTKAERQAQKVLNFGVPGGLGPKRLADYAHSTYGVVWTVEEARRAREAFLAAFHDIAGYLDYLQVRPTAAIQEATGRDWRTWRELLGLPDTLRPREVLEVLRQNAEPEVRALGERADRLLTVRLPSGRERAHCRFTEAANTHFQGLASDVLKDALWRVAQVGLSPVLAVHDEIVLEVDAGDDIEEAKRRLTDAMLAAFRAQCPRVGHLARVEVEGPLERWGAATDDKGKEITS